MNSLDVWLVLNNLWSHVDVHFILTASNPPTDTRRTWGLHLMLWDSEDEGKYISDIECVNGVLAWHKWFTGFLIYKEESLFLWINWYLTDIVISAIVKAVSDCSHWMYRHKEVQQTRTTTLNTWLFPLRDVHGGSTYLKCLHEREDDQEAGVRRDTHRQDEEGGTVQVGRNQHGEVPWQTNNFSECDPRRVVWRTDPWKDSKSDSITRYFFVLAPYFCLVLPSDSILPTGSRYSFWNNSENQITANL